MIPFPELWNHSEPIAETLERNGLAEVFSSAATADDRTAAVRALLAAGVDYGTATRLVDLTLKSLKAYAS